MQKIKCKYLLVIFCFSMIACSKSVYTVKESLLYYSEIDKNKNISTLYGMSITGYRDTSTYSVMFHDFLLSDMYNDTTGNYIELDMVLGRDNVYYNENSLSFLQKYYPKSKELIVDSSKMRMLEQVAINSIVNMHNIGLRHYESKNNSILSYTGYPNKYLLFEFDGNNNKDCCCFRLDQNWFYCDESLKKKNIIKMNIEKIITKYKIND